MKNSARMRVRQGLTWFKSTLLTAVLVVAGLLVFSVPAWAMQVRIVENDTVRYVSSAETHSTWSYDGNGNLTLNGFEGQEIAFTGGDLTIILNGENKLISDGEMYGGNLHYSPFDESPTDREINIVGPGLLWTEGGISNLGKVVIDGATVEIVPKNPDSTCRMVLTSSEVYVNNDAYLVIIEGGISVPGNMFVNDSHLDVSYTKGDDTPIEVGNFITWNNSFINVRVKGGNTSPSVTSGSGFALPFTGGGWNPIDDYNLEGNVSLVPTGFVVLKDLDENTAHLMDILWLFANGITTGFPDGGFHPYDTVKRCDMAAFLYRIAGKPTYTPTAADIAYFSDVDADTPHCNEIWWLAHVKISEGWTEPDGTHTFRPYDTVKRCDMAAFLHRLAGAPGYVLTPEDKAYFSDINAETAHASEVWWLASEGVSMGWTEGNGTHTFRPYNEIARADMAAFLHRMEMKNLVKKYW